MTNLLVDTSTWSNLDADFKPLQSRREFPSLTLCQSKIILFSGWTSAEYTNTLEIYSLDYLKDKPEWQRLQNNVDRPDTPTPRHGHTMVEWESKLYL